MSQDLAHLKILLWRQQLLLRNYKKVIIIMCLWPLMFIMMGKMLKPNTQNSPKTYQNNTDNFHFDNVTNLSSFDVLEQQGFSAKFGEQCIESKRFLIGVVEPKSIGENQQSRPGNETFFMIKDMMQVGKDQSYEFPFKQKLFESIEAMEQHSQSIESIIKNETLCVGIQFNEFDVSSKQYNVSIRYPAELQPGLASSQTNFNYGKYDTTSLQQWQQNGFVEVMQAVSQVIANREMNLKDPQAGNATATYTVHMRPAFTPDFIFDSSWMVFIIFIVMAFEMVTAVPAVCESLAKESIESEISQFCKSMGLKARTIVYSRVIQIWVVALALGIIFLPLCFYFNLFGKANAIIMTITYFLTCQCLGLTVNFILEMAGWKWVFLYFVILFLKTFLIDPQYLLVPPPGYIQYFFIVLTPSNAFAVVIRIALMFNTYYPETGLTWQNIAIVHEGVSVLLSWFFLLLNMVIITFLIYWGSREKDQGGKNSSKVQLDEESVSLLLDGEEDLVQQGHYEPVTIQSFNINQSDMDKFIKGDTLKIDRLCKEFKKLDAKNKNDKFKAVDNLSLTLFKNQILCLLGHNGAGKTTTIQMITGFLAKTSGSATAFGLDLFEDREQVQKYIGICPQHNVLSFKLTVEQNLQFFGVLRGMTLDQIRAFMEKYLPIVDLQKKRQATVSTLSGGQKRKLQLLIAIMGDTKIILLDEPSSGMDPTSRRDTWSFIQELKKDKFIILTTHYMDEADELGDRIAIMSQGKLKTCGSSLFLKKKYDLGTIIEISQIQPSQQMDEVLEIINSKLPNQISSESPEMKASGYLDESSNLFTIKVPANLDNQFKNIFEELDHKQKWEQLNIQSYNVRVTSLEEVFNMIGEQEFSMIDGQVDKGSIKTERTENQQQPQKIQLQERSFFTVVSILIKARFLIFKRRNFFIFAFLLMVINTFVNWIALSVGTQQPTYILDSTQLYKGSGNYPSSGLYSQKNQMAIGASQHDNDFIQNFLNLPVIGTFQTQEITEYEGSVNQTETLMSFSQASYDFTKKDEDEFQSVFFINQFDENGVDLDIFFNMSQGINSLLVSSISYQAVLQRINPNIELVFVDQPLPAPILTKQAPTPPVGVLGYVSWPMLRMVSDFALSIQFYEETNGIDRQKLMAGVTYKHTYFSELIFQTLFHLMASMIFYVISLKYDVNGLHVPCILYVFAQPLFNQFIRQRKFKNTFYIQYLLTGAGLFIAMSGVGHAGSQKINVPVEIGMSLVPFVGLTLSFVKLIWRSKFYTDGANDSGIVSETSNNPYNMKGCLPEIIGMAVSIFIWPLFTFISQNCCKKSEMSINQEIKQFSGIEDKAVVEEQQRVQNLINNKPELLSVSNISKSFQIEQNKTLKAVESVSFSFNKKDRFILLGLNGAGKSTTFKMLTAEEKPSSGTIKVNGLDINEIHDNPELLKNKIGYCPQNDPIWGFLTVKETLTLYAQLKGFPNDWIPWIVKETQEKFRIQIYSDSLAGNLSGGNKRKLSTAMAMMGNPPIILLDESSSGVDPYSRRLLWKTIRDESNNSVLVVTTHSMEEAEALGTTMAIMVAGKFKCFGTAQQIKSNYAQGFFIEIKLEFQDINSSSQAQLYQKQNFVDFNELVRHILECIHKELGIEDDDFKKQIVEKFLQKGLLDEFLPNYDVNQDIIQFNGSNIVAQRISNIMKVAFAFVNNFEAPQLVDYTGNTLQLRLQNPNQKSIGFVFGFVQSLTQTLPIKEFNATETTLEQVFNSFAKEQTSGSFRKKSSIDVLKKIEGK